MERQPELLKRLIDSYGERYYKLVVSLVLDRFRAMNDRICKTTNQWDNDAVFCLSSFTRFDTLCSVNAVVRYFKDTQHVDRFAKLG